MASNFDAAVLGYATSTSAYWALEDPVGTSAPVDSTGNGHTLASGTGATFGTAGIVPSDALTCATFTTSSNLTWGSYKPSNATVSFGCVCKFATVPTSLQHLVFGGGGTSGVDLRISSTSKGGIACNNVAVLTTISLLTNHVYLLVGTWDGTTQIIYQYDLTASSHTSASGAQSGSMNLAAFTPSLGAATLVGILARAFMFPGVLLTAAQIASLATIAAAAAPPPLTNGLELLSGNATRRASTW